MKKSIFLCSIFSYLWVLMPTMLHAQTLTKAAGGTGAHKEKIWWLDFASLEIAAGGSITQTYNVDNIFTLVVTIDNISFGGTLAGGLSLSSQRLIGYNSGTYGGDGLVMLYNSGVSGGGVTPFQRSQNTLFNALTLKFDGNYSGSPNEAKANFRVRAHAYINGSLDPVDVGLVFADAETDEPNPAWPYEEYSQGTTNGTSWQVFETALQDTTGWQNVIMSGSGVTARTVCGFDGTSSSNTFTPGNVVLMYTNKVNTTTTNPLKVEMEFKGGGNSATAIGFLLTGTDKGDAPTSYGLGEHIFFATVTGGALSTDGTYYINSAGTFGGTPTVVIGNIDYPQTPRLGNLAGDPDDYTTITNVFAAVDDNTDWDDEDALSIVPALNTRDSSYTLTFLATPTPGQSAYVNAWVDFDGNGTFDALEFQSTTIGNAGNVMFSWTGIAPKAGDSYLRLRVQSNIPGLPTGAADIKQGGETEDYRLNITTFITGNVYHDANGLTEPLPTVDGNGISSVNGSALYVTLLDALNNFIAQVPVNIDGSFEFDNVTVGNYTVVLTTEVNGTTHAIPESWVNTGEFVGIGPGSDLLPDGVVSVLVLQGSEGVDNVKLAIERLPDSDNHSATIAQPASGDTLSINGGLLPYLSGSDLEDGIYTNGTGDIADPSGVIITSLPSNSILLYNGSPVAVGDTLLDMSFGMLQMVLTGTGYTEVIFEYAYVDMAGYADPTSATYIVNWGTPLPITLLYFNAQAVDNKALLTWTTAIETTNKGFEIEQSANGWNWNSIGFVSTKSETGNSDIRLDYMFSDYSPLNGTNYYRLKQIDFDGNYDYSLTRKIIFNADMGGVNIYPNPTRETVYIKGLQGGEIVQVHDMMGKLLIHQLISKAGIHNLPLQGLAKGIYNVRISNTANNIKAFKLELE